MSKKGYWDILDECKKIALEREEQHGAYDENFKIFSLSNKDSWEGMARGIEAICDLKYGRFITKRKHNKKLKEDDLIDLINYFAMRLDWERKNK